MKKEINEVIEFLDNESKKLEKENNVILSEMSMAWEEHLKGKHSVCVWVENPSSRDNRYMKYYDNEFYDLAEKVARIRIDKAAYVGGEHSENDIQPWVLSEGEKKEFVELLKSPSKKNPQYTNWQQVILTYNADNFHIYEPITGDMTKYKNRKSPLMPSYILPFPIDYPMPDYLNLE